MRGSRVYGRHSFSWRWWPRPSRRTDRGRCRPARGQGLVEFALCCTLMLFLLMGLFDVGLLLDAHLAVTVAAHQGAQAAAGAANRSTADCDALASIALATARVNGLAVTRIVIYQAGADGRPLGGTPANANVYLGNPGCPNPQSPPTPSRAGWPGSARNACFYTMNSLGIEIDYTYTWQTTAIALGALPVMDYAVMPLAADMTIGNC